MFRLAKRGPRSLIALDFVDAPVTVLPDSGVIPPVVGKVVAGTLNRYGDEALLEELQSRKPALILLFEKSGRAARAGRFLDDVALHHPPVIRIRDSSALELLKGTERFTLSLHLAQANRSGGLIAKRGRFVARVGPAAARSVCVADGPL